MSVLEVRLLGPFEVIVAGKPVEVRGAKRQALVAFLALRAGRVVATTTPDATDGPTLARLMTGADLPAVVPRTTPIRAASPGRPRRRRSDAWSPSSVELVRT